MKKFAVLFAAVCFAAPAQAGSAMRTLSLEAAAVKAPAAAAVVAPAAAAPVEDINKGKAPLVEVDAAAMKDKATLMAEFSLKLRVPVDNWDALIDCLSDMPDTLGEKKVVFLIKNAGGLQARDKALYDNLVEVAGAAAERTREWSRGRAQVEFFFLP